MQTQHNCLSISVWTKQAGGEEPDPDPADAVDGISEDGRNLLSVLLDVDEERRLSVEDAIQHPWFGEVRLAGRAHSGCRPRKGLARSFCMPGARELPILSGLLCPACVRRLS